MSDKDKNAELLPCPFCDGIPYTQEWENKSGDLIQKASRVQCSCGANSPEGYGDTCKERAIKFWNIRAEPQSKDHKICPQCQQVRPLAELDGSSAYQASLNLAVFLQKQYYSGVTQWKPLDNTVGIITQIDNMVAGLPEYFRNYDKSSRNQEKE